MFTFVWMHVYYCIILSTVQCVKTWLYSYSLTVTSAPFEGNQNADLAFGENDFDASGSNLEGLQGRNLNPERGSHKDRTINQAEICPSVWRRWITISVDKKHTTTFVPVLPANYPHQLSLQWRPAPLNGPNLPQQISSHSHPSFRKAHPQPPPLFTVAQ